MTIIDYGTEFQIEIDFDRWFKRNINAVKSISGARWNYRTKRWHVHGDMRSDIEELAMATRAQIMEPANAAPEVTGEIAELPDLTIELPLKATLRPYQGRGIARAMELQRCIIGDEQGLGKTLQAIGTIVGLKTLPALVICPSTLKENWKREIEKFTSLKAMILDDRVKNTWPQYWKVGLIQVFIVNYESLKKFFVESMPDKRKMHHSKDIKMKETIALIKAVIVDESHRCKDPGTMQAKLVMRICWRKETVLLLSGTPVINKPVDLYPQLCIMNRQGHFGALKKDFLNRYCQGGRGAANLRELNFLLNQFCFFRREKKDVAKDLPEKSRQTFVCEITTRAEYQKAEREFVQYLKDQGCSDREIARKLRGEIMVKMGQLKQISARGKIHEVKEFIEEILESGEKLVLFCNLHEIVDQVKNLFPDAVTVTGRDDMARRQRHIDSFQNDSKCQLIVCNIKAGGVGITLTASSRVAFIEYPWTYSDCVQCEDRCHRIGQTSNVMATYFFGKDTIDERLFEIIQEKKEIANTITGASDTMEMETVNKVLDLFNI